MSAVKRVTTSLIVTAACVAALLVVRERPGVDRPGSDLVYPAPPESRMLQRRMATRVIVIEQLLAGELSLLEAAVRFRYLNEVVAGHRVSLLHWPGDSDGERLCRQVLDWTESHLQGKKWKPAEVEAALCPLRCEFQRLLDTSGVIDLPPADGPVQRAVAD